MKYQVYLVSFIAIIGIISMVIIHSGTSSSNEVDDQAIAGQAFMVDMSCEGYSDEEVRVARAGCETCLAFAENVFLQCKLDAEKKYCDGDCPPAYTDAIEMCNYMYSDYVYDCENGWTIDCAVCSK